MKTFKDLDSKPHPLGMGGTQAKMKFENNKTISVIQGIKRFLLWH